MGTRRVLIVGDSVSWGWGVNDGERYSDLLEQRMGSGVQIINLSVPGYGTDQEWWTPQAHGWNYEPDLLLHCVVLNDVLESKSNSFYDMAKPRFELSESGTWEVDHPLALQAGSAPWQRARRWFGRLRDRSAFLTWASGRDYPMVEASFLDSLTYIPASTDMQRGIEELVGQVVDPTSPMNHALGLIAGECQRRAVPLIAFTMPHGHDRYLYEPNFPFPPRALNPEYHSPLTREVLRAAKNLEFEALSIDAVMLRETRKGQRLHGGDGHPNQAAHRLIAEFLEPILRKRLHALDNAEQRSLSQVGK